MCYRVVRAARKLGAASNESGADAFVRYCTLESLPVDEAKLCYDVDSFKQDILNLFNYGADENRICKKVHSINYNFCSVKKKDTILPGTRSHRNARGIIFE